MSGSTSSSTLSTAISESIYEIFLSDAVSVLSTLDKQQNGNEKLSSQSAVFMRLNDSKLTLKNIR